MFMLAFAPAALAIPTDSGSQSCGAQWVMIRSYGEVTVTHFWPNGTPQVSYNNTSGPAVRTSHTSTHSTSWKVTADDTLYLAETYAYCVPYS